MSDELTWLPAWWIREKRRAGPIVVGGNTLLGAGGGRRMDPERPGGSAFQRAFPQSERPPVS